jgi:hypothetical protein
VDRTSRHGTVVAYLALFVALGAGAYAAGLGKNSVKSKNIAPKAVKASDIAPNAVDGSKVKDESLTASEIAPDAVDGSKVKDESLTATEIAPDAVDGSKVKDESLTGADVDESTLQGLGGFSPGDPLPSGKTETGAWGWFDPSGGSSGPVYLGVTLPFRAPVALSAATVNFTTSGLASDDDPTCAGTAETPTAPAGKVCIYVDHGSSTPGALEGLAAGLPGPSAVGFVIASQAPLDNGQASGTWAYTAP